jgi:hypothetical protein
MTELAMLPRAERMFTAEAVFVYNKVLSVL